MTKRKPNKKTLPVNVSDGEILLPKIKTQLTAPLYPKDYEKTDLPSETKPGQAMTILQMIERHRRGYPIDQAKGALYQGDELIEDISQMDLVDRHAYMDSVADQLVELKQKIAAAAKTEEEKKFVDRVDKEVQEHLAKIRSQQSDKPLE